MVNYFRQEIGFESAIFCKNQKIKVNMIRNKIIFY